MHAGMFLAHALPVAVNAAAAAIMYPARAGAYVGLTGAGRVRGRVGTGVGGGIAFALVRVRDCGREARRVSSCSSGSKRGREKTHTQDGSDRRDGLVFALIEVGDKEMEDGRILFWEVDRLCA